MSGAKETPRQKMIAMMYLVLTALLALNVSVEVLDAFATVNEGLEATNESIEKKIEDYYVTFKQQYDKDPSKSKENWEKAQTIRAKTDELVNYIENDVKLSLLMDCNGATKEELFNPEKEKDKVVLNPEVSKNRRVYYNLNLKNVKNLDKHDAVTARMITNGLATELRTKINDYRNFIISTLESVGYSDYASHVGLITDNTFTTSTGETLNWEYKNFNHVIAPAAFSIINELVAEIQTTEYDAVAELFKNIGASDFKFSTLEAKVFPKSTYILSGQNYEADVFIIASDNSKEFNAKYMNAKQFDAKSKAVKSVSSDHGIVKINIPTNSVGEQFVSGVIEMTDPVTGEIVNYPFETEYTVAPPSATASPTKLNIIYRGLDNPIQISAPGFTSDQLEVAINKGSIKKMNDQGLYAVNISDSIAQMATITTSVTIDGKKQILGSSDFKIKEVPQPKVTISGAEKGEISRLDLRKADRLIVELPDFDFDGYEFTIVSYSGYKTVAGELRPIAGTGEMFPKELKDYFNTVSKNQVIQFHNIKAKGPGGIITELDPCYIKVK